MRKLARADRRVKRRSWKPHLGWRVIGHDGHDGEDEDGDDDDGDDEDDDDDGDDDDASPPTSVPSLATFQKELAAQLGGRTWHKIIILLIIIIFDHHDNDDQEHEYYKLGDDSDSFTFQVH